MLPEPSSPMSSLTTFWNLPISAGFEDHATTSRVSLDWVINSGLPTHSSQVSGVLTLSSNIGVISMLLNNIPVASSLTSDLLLGLAWFNFATSLAPELVVYQVSGVSLDLRRPPPSTSGTIESSTHMF
ncbi:hypothetical protein B0H19DRAFT_1122096 [Mycena capillaripes]|nr:hypothetical protein B0H19DRAFT_1155491 [Mycena capillaripes]KAJ6578011.1 hypothetical protein B0H19DRAFT_1122096 [Mycena capillaripes]